MSYPITEEIQAQIEVERSWFLSFFNFQCKLCPVPKNKSQGIDYCSRLPELYDMINKQIGYASYCCMDKLGNNYEAALGSFAHYVKKECPLKTIVIEAQRQMTLIKKPDASTFGKN
ncbi:hypothetical protein AUK40_01250 [Candidatus Wirthbacteria bacterium CG2_30_54_11]|uniref:Uncharacterized protein n=1 Tax=Candidatus Wirthbacteria bacterium CG2_30_54_11 TaxID=1817892 RepID=A0A1J5INN1_9BACT|nr:MAG: hypothetical protein AUK40_01250 [Candidatus Wirthbacteria bacterium CG2_30_54_11]